MPAFDFPDSPSVGDTVTIGTQVRQWNGTAWMLLSTPVTIQGLTGSQGVTGIQGAQGLQGLDGAFAAQGIQGVAGSQGVQGIDGAYAAQGIQGTQGFTGKFDFSAATPPASPYEGQIWFDTETVKTYVWYDNYWIEVASSSSVNQYLRTPISVTTSVLAANASENITITGYKSFSLMSVQTSNPAWVVLYSTSAARSADSSRPISVDPVVGSGVIAEVATINSQPIILSPYVFGGNMDSPPTDNIYARITNLGTTSQTITVVLTLLRLEI